MRLLSIGVVMLALSLGGCFLSPGQNPFSPVPLIGQAGAVIGDIGNVVSQATTVPGMDQSATRPAPPDWIDKVVSLTRFGCGVAPLVETVAHIWLAAAGSLPEQIANTVCQHVTNNRAFARKLRRGIGKPPVVDYGQMIIGNRQVRLLVGPPR